MSGAPTLLDPEETSDTDAGPKSACAACGQQTRGRADMLCAACWKKAPRDAVAEWRRVWNAVRFEGQPESLLTRATEDFAAVVRGDAPTTTIGDTMSRSIPQGKRTLTCSCGADYEFTPGIGRPPTKCLKCRGVSPTPAPKRAPAPVVQKADPSPEPSTALAIVEPPAAVVPVRPAPTSMSSIDVAAIRAQVSAEIAQLERQISARVMLERSLAALESLQEPARVTL